MTKNQIDYWALQETKRANLARETEQARSNKAQEAISVAYNQGTLNLRAKELDETSRHNVSVEQETSRSNQAREAETRRHNVEAERAALLSAQAASTSAAASWLSAQARQSEVKSANTLRTIQGLITSKTFHETERHNKEMEEIQDFAAQARFTTDLKHAQAAEKNAETARINALEQMRANLQNERIGFLKLDLQEDKNMIDLAGIAASALSTALR